MKLKLVLAIILVSLLSFIAIEYCGSSANQSNNTAASEIAFENAAFHAVKTQGSWILSLEPKHFSDQVKSIAVTYSDTFYGVFLLSDKIYLPVLVPDNAELILSPLDSEGNPLSTEVFTVGESHALSKVSGH